jgi:uncharacterized protein (DUF1697 family)
VQLKLQRAAVHVTLDVGALRLKARWETAGFDEVTTYIQNGNAIFTAASSPRVFGRH